MLRYYGFSLSLSLFVIVFYSLQVDAFIHGGLSGGYRGALGNNIGSSPEIRTFLHVNPIAIVPASLGFSYSYMSPIDIPNEKKIEIGELSFGLSVWSPVSLWSIVPYLRGRVPFYTYFTGRDASYLEAKAFTGFHGDLGLRWAFVSMFSIFLEGGLGINSYEIEGKKLGGFYNFLAGLQVIL
jgi:hypothetical protein